jgi:hypothetical protein
VRLLFRFGSVRNDLDLMRNPNSNARRVLVSGKEENSRVWRLRRCHQQRLPEIPRAIGSTIAPDHAEAGFREDSQWLAMAASTMTGVASNPPTDGCRSCHEQQFVLPARRDDTTQKMEASWWRLVFYCQHLRRLAVIVRVHNELRYDDGPH